MENKRLISETDKIYEKDAYVATFEATVISCKKIEDKYGVILDATVFFPEGGGQTSDTGKLNDLLVNDVQLVDGNIIHYTEGEIAEGSQVTGKIDWESRYRKMQNHSGEHLFCGIIHNKYGYDNVGFHMDEEEVTLDVNGELSTEQLKEVEMLANKAVYENQTINISFPSSDELVNMEYRSKLDMLENVRLVTIENYDVCACCAPHVARTGEIGIIKIIDSFFHRGGTRITIRAGISAFEDYVKLNEANRGLTALLSAKRYETHEFAVKFDRKYHALIEENIRLKKLLSENESKDILEKMALRTTDDVTPEIIFSETFDRVQMRNVINSVVEKYSIIVAGFIGSDKEGYDYIIGKNKALDINLSLKAKEINAAFDGSGGGKPEMIQGHINGRKKEIINFIKKNL